MVESYHTERTEQSHSRPKSQVSHDQETRKLQREIDRLHRRLKHRERDRRSPSSPPSVVLRETGNVHIIVGLELHLVSPTQLLHVKIGWIKAVINMRKGLPTMAWEMMQ
nr:hypothetical protein CFP56_44881 [Quercus suber]